MNTSFDVRLIKDNIFLEKMLQAKCHKEYQLSMTADCLFTMKHTVKPLAI